MKQRSLSFALTLAALVLAGCNNNKPAGDNVSPTTKPTPAQITSSADVVKVSAADLSVAAGQPVEATIRLLIRSGFHINANPPTFSYLIPTEVTPAKIAGITVGKPAYPAAVTRKFQFADQPLAVYEGEALVKLPLNVTAGVAKGPRSLPITLRVQACDEEQCFPPATLNAAIQIEVK